MVSFPSGGCGETICCNKLPVYFSHSHIFHEWRRSVRVALYENYF